MKLGGRILISLEGCERFFFVIRQEGRENGGGEGQRNVRQTDNRPIVMEI